MITAKEFEAIVERFLEEGTPPGVVSRALNLEIDLVKDAQKKVRVRKYGTDDLDDYTEQTQWDAVEVFKTVLATGSTSEKARFASIILGKQLSAIGKRKPQSQREQTEQLEDLFREMRGA